MFSNYESEQITFFDDRDGLNGMSLQLQVDTLYIIYS